MSFSLEEIYNWYRSTIRNPKYRWWIILGTLAYLISPIDIAPDFIPLIGQLDDALMITILFTELSQMLIERVKSKKVRTAQVNRVSSPEANTDVDVKAVPIE
ncbi:MAG TPA: DUF1232 domain-containing protein [Synechococcales cyanobacterium M55_K2018_004]|nr:DUF1232 domain-containing protein [Synechococcales cyanobacterium M55_K2018_004]